MYLLDAFFRFSGIAMLLLIAITAYRDNRAWQSTPYLVLACITVAALYLGYTPDVFRLPAPLHIVVRVLDVPHLVFVWLFAQSLYRKDFRLSAMHWLVGVVYAAPIFWIRLESLMELPAYPPWLLIYISVTSFLLAAHLIYSALGELKDDLQESRRRSRLYFTTAVVLAIAAAALSEPSLDSDSAIDVRTFTILSIWPAIAAGAYWLLTANTKAFQFRDVRHGDANVAQRDKLLLQKLEEAMNGLELYRNPDLSISALARQLGVTQHRLRGLINQVLGYRNFSTYLSAHRLDAVINALQDPSKAHIPIQTIALESGFRSIAPFNRAFRDREGMTPSEYRNTLASS